MTPDQRTYFATNLRALCAAFGSISEVSRQTDLNRQQLNKYLSGASRPSATTLNRLCQFFDVSSTQLLLPPAEFSAAHQNKAIVQGLPQPVLQTLPGLFAKNPETTKVLSSYCGVYFTYIASKNNAGLYRTLLQIFQKDGFTYYKELQVFARQEERVNDYPVHKFSGMIFLTGNRLHMVSVEHPNSPNMTLAMSIFYPSTHPRKDLLIGKIVTVSNFWSRRINNSAHILEYAGTPSPTKAQLRQCGYFEQDDPSVSDAVRNRIFSDD